jgi:hypothetical protein
MSSLNCVICFRHQCLVVVAGVDVINGNILEEHIVDNEAININNIAIEWVSHGTVVKESISVSDVLIAVVAVVDQNTVTVFAPDLVAVIVKLLAEIKHFATFEASTSECSTFK